MLDEKAVVNLGAREALGSQIKSHVHVELHVTRWFIWTLKLRHCWAILRAPVFYKEGDEATTQE